MKYPEFQANKSPVIRIVDNDDNDENDDNRLKEAQGTLLSNRSNYALCIVNYALIKEPSSASQPTVDTVLSRSVDRRSSCVN